MKAACIDEPHWRSTDVPHTVSGQPATSDDIRATLSACSPTWLTQPIWTSSISPGIEVEPADEAVQHLRGELVGADAREGAVPPPDRRPDASTMSASVMP